MHPNLCTGYVHNTSKENSWSKKKDDRPLLGSQSLPHFNPTPMGRWANGEWRLAPAPSRLWIFDAKMKAFPDKARSQNNAPFSIFQQTHPNSKKTIQSFLYRRNFDSKIVPRNKSIIFDQRRRSAYNNNRIKVPKLYHNNQRTSITDKYWQN